MSTEIETADDAFDAIAQIVAQLNDGSDDDAPPLCEALAQIRDLAEQGIAAEAAEEARIASLTGAL